MKPSTSTPDPKTKKARVGMDVVAPAMSRGEGASAAVTGSHKNTMRNDDGNFTDASTPAKSDENDTSYVQNDLPYFNGNEGSPGFEHDDDIIVKVTDILKSITSTGAAKYQSNHINGMIRLFPLNDINIGKVRKILSWFPPKEIIPIVAKGFDVCTRTDKDIEQLVDGSKVAHAGTINTEGTTYEKDVSAKVLTWKSVNDSMQGNRDNYLVDSVAMVHEAVKKINDLGLGDNECYTGSYIGESSTQTTAGRDKREYPDILYEVGIALDVPVRVRKVSDVIPFNVKQSLFQEAFHATLLQQATTLTRQDNGRGGECRLLLWFGEGFNSVRTGERDQSVFSSDGYSLLDFFQRNYGCNGKIPVLDADGEVCDGFNNAIFKGGVDQRSNVLSYFERNKSSIRNYIADDNLRGKTKREVIKNANVDLTIEYGYQYFGYIVGKKNYELGRGIFSREYIQKYQETILKKYFDLFERQSKKEEYLFEVELENEEKTTVFVPPNKFVRSWVRRVWDGAKAGNEYFSYLKDKMVEKGYQFEYIDKGIKAKSDKAAEDIIAQGKVNAAEGRRYSDARTEQTRDFYAQKQRELDDEDDLS